MMCFHLAENSDQLWEGDAHLVLAHYTPVRGRGEPVGYVQ